MSGGECIYELCECVYERSVCGTVFMASYLFVLTQSVDL